MHRTIALALALWVVPSAAAADVSVSKPARPQVIRMTVRGRAARPLVEIHVARAEHRFSVGTERYSTYRPRPSRAP